MARKAIRLKSLAAALLAGAVAGVALPAPAAACAFHADLPERTAIDWVIETGRLVLARPDPDNPFAFKATETLAGGGRDVVITELLDSYTRRALAASPGDAVLFGFDAGQQEWRRIAYLTPAYRGVVERVLAEMDSWAQPYSPARFEIFEALQTHPERALRDLALREIDKAPYEILRTIDLQIPASELLEAMNALQGYAYIPVRALLLGLSGEDAARAKLRSYIDSVAEWDRGTAHLGAFATGLIEIDGPDGIARLEEKMLRDPGQPLAKLEHVVEALALHNGLAGTGLREDIRGALDRLVTARPEAAPLVARQFGKRSDWSQAPRLALLIDSKILNSAAELLPVAVYVAQAKAAGALAPRVAKGG